MTTTSSARGTHRRLWPRSFGTGWPRHPSAVPEPSRTRHVSRGKLLPRDRVERLLDPGSPFLELAPLRGRRALRRRRCPRRGSSQGSVSCTAGHVMVVCNDATVKGGAYLPMTVKKHLRHRRWRWRIGCHASTSWTPGARSCRSRTRSFRTAITSGASSSTRPGCRQRASRRSRPCSARARRAARTSRR